MLIAYLDCFSGVSGDMLLGAIIDSGLDEGKWLSELAKLNLHAFDVEITRTVRNGISGTKVDIKLSNEDTSHGRHLSNIVDIINASQFSEIVKSRITAVFTRLAAAEARIHATSPESIHFHEVGAVDAIADISGACIGFEMLGIQQLYVSELPFTRGWVDCAHGRIPVPTPATLALLNGFCWRHDPRPMELITPTGAAIVAEFTERTEEGYAAPCPRMRLKSTGYGAGNRQTEIPNLLRLCIGEAIE